MGAELKPELTCNNQDRDITNLCYWESSVTAIASVSNAAGTRGEVTGNAEGNAQITASYQNVTSPTVPVTVNTPVNQQPVAVLEGDAIHCTTLAAEFQNEMIAYAWAFSKTRIVVDPDRRSLPIIH